MNYKPVYSLCMTLLVHSYWVWTDLKPRLRGLYHWWLPDEFTNAIQWPCLMHLFTYLMNWRREAGWWFRGMELSTYWFRRVPSPMEIDHFDVVLWQVRSYFYFFFVFGFFCSLLKNNSFTCDIPGYLMRSGFIVLPRSRLLSRVSFVSSSNGIAGSSRELTQVIVLRWWELPDRAVHLISKQHCPFVMKALLPLK